MNENTDGYSNTTERKLSLIQAHFGRIASRLKAEGDAARSFDHGTNRGQIREAFIREFLSQNTSPLTGIGTGEIIHAGSKPEDSRNQIDVVIHNNRYPKISLAAGIDLFFSETVSSFIEIKSSLTKNDLRHVARTTKKIKENVTLDRQRFNPTGIVKNPRPYSFVFAYDGPSRITTVLNWMKQISTEEEYNIDELRNTSGENREYFDNLFIDGVFVLGKGYVHLDVLPFQSVLRSLELEGETIPTASVWVYGREDELPILWLLVNELSEKYIWNNLDLFGYLGTFGRNLCD